MLSAVYTHTRMTQKSTPHAHACIVHLQTNSGHTRTKENRAKGVT